MAAVSALMVGVLTLANGCCVSTAVGVLTEKTGCCVSNFGWCVESRNLLLCQGCWLVC
jgi:hypothetical protein